MAGLTDFLKYTPIGMATNNSVGENFLANLGFGTSDATKAAQQNLEEAKQAYGSLETPTLAAMTPALETAEQEGPIREAQAVDEVPSAYNDIAVNPEDRAAQMDQLAALQNLAKNGGRNAASDAALAQIQQQENQNARGQREAILQNAHARGMGGSGAALLAQLAASQNAINNQSAQDLGIRGQEANTALQAGMGAANIGSNLENQDYAQQAQKAAAADAIARFNAGQQSQINQYNAGAANQAAMFNANQRANANQYNAGAQNAAQQYNTGLHQTMYNNQFQKQAGIAGANMSGVNFNQAQANMGAQQAGNILGAGVKLGTAMAGAPAAHGGRIPGIAPVKGDSNINDSVHTMLSPGEVVVPRSLAMGGSSHDISHFVKHPPSVKIPGSNSDREAMLGALKNIRNRRSAM